jgi:Mn2+/Fe2+ NRAMP family transporter
MEPSTSRSSNTRFFVPHVHLNTDALLLIISMVGTTVAPWQLFFQQSNVIDKRLTPRWMAYERADTVIGAFVVILGAAALIIATAFAFKGTNLAGTFTDAGAVARSLAEKVGPLSGAFFAIVLLNASLIGAASVTLSTSYAFGDVFGIKHSLQRNWRDARGFYVCYTILIFISGGIVLIPHVPLGLITTAVQALASVLLPSATVFLLLLCNDKGVLGPWVNKMWLNVVSSIIIGVLVMLSFILAVTTLFPDVNVRLLTEVLAGILVIGLLIAGLLYYRQREKNPTHSEPELDRLTWRMSPLRLPKPIWSKTRKLGMILLRGYLLVAVIMLIVKAVQLALGH